MHSFPFPKPSETLCQSVKPYTIIESCGVNIFPTVVQNVDFGKMTFLMC